MGERIFQKVYQSLSGYSAVMICGIGEPTLHPLFLQYTEQLRHKTNNLSLVTNGQLFSEKKIAQLVGIGIDKIFVSLDYIDEKKYKEVKKGDLKRVLNFIHSLINERDRQKSETSVQVNFLAEQGKEDEIYRAIRYFTPLFGESDCLYSREVKNLTGKISVRKFDEGNPKALKELRNKLAVKTDVSKFVVEDWMGLLQREDVFTRRGICLHPFTYAMVFWNGDLAPCCMDFCGEMVRGSLKNESLTSIWKGPAYTEFRRSMEQLNFSNYPLCRKCDDWYKCC